MLAYLIDLFELPIIMKNYSITSPFERDKSDFFTYFASSHPFFRNYLYAYIIENFSLTLLLSYFIFLTYLNICPNTGHNLMDIISNLLDLL